MHFVGVVLRNYQLINNKNTLLLKCLNNNGYCMYDHLQRPEILRTILSVRWEQNL